ncbi:PE-PPE domain-containing protein [Mycobacterium sp. SMC-4]|uniref:PE-PPE domain-containing protein n=1 Tax=Mycobacterium sp. SMC-4 TaxID=2857059 RepID=UPI003D05985A
MGSALLALSTATTGGAASSALVIGGISTPSLHDVVMSRLLGGALQDRERVSVQWPAEAGPYTGRDDLPLGQSINIGVENLSAEIDAALDRLERDENGNVLNGETVTVVGLSAGSLVVTEVLREMADDPDAPDASEINFIVVADSSRQELIRDARYNPRYDYTYQPAPQTEYDTIEVTGEYDGLADFPDRPWNLLAVANAFVGSVFVHVPVMFADLDDVPPEYITTTVNSQGGTVTRYLVPAERLPLVQLLPFLEPMEPQLKEIIDRGYSRNDLLGTSSPLSEAVTAASATSALSARTALSAQTATDESDTAETSLRRASARAAALADESPRTDTSATSEKTATTAEATTVRAETRSAKATSAKAEAEPSEAASAKAEAKSAKTEAASAKSDDSKADAKSAVKAEAKPAKDSKASSESKADSKSASKSSASKSSGSDSSDSKKSTSKKRDSKAGSR